MDPYPFKHPAIVLAQAREAVEAELLQAGFVFVGRNKPRGLDARLYLFLDYERGAEMLRLAWDRRASDLFLGLSAELLNGAAEHVWIARVSLNSGWMPNRAVTAWIQSRLNAFSDLVQEFLRARNEPAAC